jgi:hypothetical protein
MSNQPSSRPCSIQGCTQFASVGELICDDHLIAGWVEKYIEENGHKRELPCGHSLAAQRYNLDGTEICLVCAINKRIEDSK